MISWRIKGREFVNCNCDYGCPCQFDALPPSGYCESISGYLIEEGHFGDVPLHGLKAVMTVSWPGPIHEGNGTMQVIVDERANTAQRDALVKILTGEETKDLATIWSVFAHTVTTALDPLFKPIEIEIDVEERTARLVVPDLIEGKGEPIRNRVTGEIHRARIDLPNGFEYLIAEMGSGTTKCVGGVKLDFNDSYGQFANIELTNNGTVRPAA